jgi:uncharacterized membrane protein
MNKIIEFAKTTVVGGLVVIVPITIIVLALNHVLMMLIEFAGTAAEKTPFDVLTQTSVVISTSVMLIVAICFVTGLILRTSVGHAIREWIDVNLAARLPLYAMLKNLTQRFVGVEGTQFTPAEIDVHGSAARVLGFIVESLPGDRYTVFVPHAPLATVGQIYILPRAQVQPLDAPLSDMVNTVAQWGIGSNRLYK